MDDFMEEARLSCLAVHKNILRFIGVTSDFDNPQLLSELVGCGDLRRCLKDGKLINGTKKKHKDLFCQVLSALQYLCEAQYILHRDLAARNCLLGSNMQLKLCDFGMARQVKDDEYVAEIDEKVPVRWSAPEVLQSLRYSTASDIWAAGVVFWEICANGMLPYDGLDNSEVTKKITNQGNITSAAGVSWRILRTDAEMLAVESGGAPICRVTARSYTRDGILSTNFYGLYWWYYHCTLKRAFVNTFSEYFINT